MNNTMNIFYFKAIQSAKTKREAYGILAKARNCVGISGNQADTLHSLVIEKWGIENV